MEAHFEVEPGVRLCYIIDDFTDPWRRAETVLMVHGLDLREEVKKIRCPSLIITTTGSGLRTVESVKAWQSQMPGSQLLVLESNAWHAAGALPDECARATADFLAQVKS